MDNLTSYFKGDTMTIDTWKSKYQMKDKHGNPLEETPYDMHMRMAKEFARIEDNYRAVEESKIDNSLPQLSEFGRKLFLKRLHQTRSEIVSEVFSYFDQFKYIIPQGSIMANLGNPHVFGSLSNCFGISPPKDSYAGIMRTDEELAQLMKRRGGVGTHLNNLRPTGAYVSNVSKSSTGVPSFAERYSNTTREVAQEGRRGALMLLLGVQHPDIFRFISMKEDRTKVTGANVTVMFTDDFMQQVKSNAADYICRFPVDDDEIIFEHEYSQLKEFNKLYHVGHGVHLMKIRPVELFDEFVRMAHSNGEPGAAFIDRIVNYSPDGVYLQYKPELCNPCGEQWFHANDTCRLIALNFFSIVTNAFQEHADFDLDKLYEIAYMQQRYGDDLVDLEVEYIDRILAKLERDPEELELKRVEIELWNKIRKIALDGRRTGNGFTGLGDMIAAMGWKYGEAKSLVALVMRTKMEAELDATIDMSILRGNFTGWNRNLEMIDENEGTEEKLPVYLRGENDFYRMLIDTFPKQAERMFEHGRRNVSWSTVAPTGTVSLMTQTTSGLEPLFKAYYVRRKKINPSDEGVRVDYVDTMGDKWQEYHVLHPKFKLWLEYINDLLFIETTGEQKMNIDKLTTTQLETLFEKSPWFGSQAEDIDYSDRIDIQSIIQTYTSNAISCTLNLPEEITVQEVEEIYMTAWERGLKGVTIYREGSRTGVLIADAKLTNCDEFGYTDAIPRPETLEADYHFVRVKGSQFAVVVGKLNHLPYELFAFENPLIETDLKGSVTKITNGIYKFDSPNYKIDNIQLSSERSDERLLTRWTSMLLRYGVNPEQIIAQVEKSEVTIVNFAKAITRVLKRYVVDKLIEGEACANCGEHAMIYEEGCKRCSACGHSKC